MPIFITTFSGAQLQEAHITSAQDLQATVPSLVVGSNGQGVRDAPTFTLRGQGSTFEGSPGVAVYLDEVPLPAPITLSNQGGPGNFLDLANVQILAGPQGTLFGRNTTGGAVLLVPNKPNDRFGGYVQGTYGNYNDRELQGVINIPLIPGVLSTRLAVESKDRGGFTYDVAQHVWRDDVHYITGRFGVKWTPTSKLENYTMAYYTDSHNHGPGSINEGINVPGIVGTNSYYWGTTGGAIGCNPATTASDPVSCVNQASYLTNLAAQAKAYGPRKTALDVQEFDDILTWGVTNTTRYQATPDTDFRNIASYAYYDGNWAIDSDGTPYPQYDTGVNGLSKNASKDKFEAVTDEVQVQGKALDGNLTYTAGTFFFLQQTLGTNSYYGLSYCMWNLYVYNMCSAMVAPAQFTFRSHSEAAYAQGTYNIGQLVPKLQGLKLTLGYRYSWDQIDGTALFNGLFSGHMRSSSPSWTAGLAYNASRRLLLYGKVSHGYKAGGFNTYSVYPNTRTFGPEYDTAYEVGLKSNSYIGSMPVQFNIDAYRTDYSKIQRAAADYNPATFTEGAVMLSSASAIIQGIDVHGIIKPTRLLELGADYGYTDAYYTKFPYTPNLSMYGYTDCNGKPWLAGTQLNLACRPLQYVVPNIFSAYMQYTLPVNESLGAITFYLHYSYEGAQHTEALFGSQQPFELLKSYSLVNMSLTWQRIFGKPVDVSFYVTNVTGALYRTTNTDTWESLGVASTLYGEPRMFGIRLRYHFGDE